MFYHFLTCRWRRHYSFSRKKKKTKKFPCVTLAGNTHMLYMHSTLSVSVTSPFRTWTCFPKCWELACLRSSFMFPSGSLVSAQPLPPAPFGGFSPQGRRVMLVKDTTVRAVPVSFNSKSCDHSFWVNEKILESVQHLLRAIQIWKQ